MFHICFLRHVYQTVIYHDEICLISRSTNCWVLQVSPKVCLFNCETCMGSERRKTCFIVCYYLMLAFYDTINTCLLRTLLNYCFLNGKIALKRPRHFFFLKIIVTLRIIALTTCFIIITLRIYISKRTKSLSNSLSSVC